jgi:hypothetical protein
MDQSKSARKDDDSWNRLVTCEGSGNFNMAIQKPEGHFIFQSFSNYRDFRDFHNQANDSSHYEIISKQQCLYFDFDCKADNIDWTILPAGNGEEQDSKNTIKGTHIEATLERLKNAILTWFFNKSPSGREELPPIIILVYSSSDPIKGVRQERFSSLKCSYHVVVKGICFTDHVSCGVAAREIISNDAILLSAFDSSVYTSSRNLRILGSRKVNSSRVKKFFCTLFKSPCYNCRYLDDPLYMSLVSAIGDCKIMPMDVEHKKQTQSISNIGREKEEYMLSILSDYLPGVFCKRETQGNRITLKRLKPANCPVCSRVHSSDNAYITLFNEQVRFTCFRDLSNSIFLVGNEEEILVKEMVPKEEIIEETTGKNKEISRKGEDKRENFREFCEKIKEKYPLKGNRVFSLL